MVDPVTRLPTLAAADGRRGAGSGIWGALRRVCHARKQGTGPWIFGFRPALDWVDHWGIAFGIEVPFLRPHETELGWVPRSRVIELPHQAQNDRPPLPSRPGRNSLLAVLAWTALVGLVLGWWMSGNDGPSVWVFQERELEQPGFSDRVDALLHSDLGLQRTYPWILFGPYLAVMAWFFPLERERLRRNLPLNAAACLVFLWACQGVNRRTAEMRRNVIVVRPDSAAAPASPPMAAGGTAPGGDVSASPRFGAPSLDLERRLPSPRSPRRSLKATVRSTVVDLLAYGAFTGVVHAVNFYRRLRERERRALFLESTLAKARLGTLKAQLQPHFLFNSLNAIAALLRRDPRLAEATLISLSGLLRLALSRSEKQEGPFREELEFVERYLEIQQVRFGDRLKVELKVEPETLDCVVPTLVLQPLVENAIRHGIEPADRPGTVRVGASRREGVLVLTVEDDGVGLGGPKPDVRTSEAWGGAGTGIGLANLRERLGALYGARQSLQLTPRAGGGVVVRVEIPQDGESGNHR